MKTLPILLVTGAILGFIFFVGKRKNQLTIAEMKTFLIELNPEMEKEYNAMTSSEIEKSYFEAIADD